MIQPTGGGGRICLDRVSMAEDDLTSRLISQCDTASKRVGGVRGGSEFLIPRQCAAMVPLA